MIEQHTAQFPSTGIAENRKSITAHQGRSLVRRLTLAPVHLLVDTSMRVLGPNFRAYHLAIAHTPPRVLETIGAWRAERATEHARRGVPAMRRFHAGPPHVETTMLGTLSVPLTDKASYVEAYPMADRCHGGRIPGENVAIDESSGSSGTPFNWIRTRDERRATHVFIAHFARYCFGAEPFITINAFSMGAWATGMNMAAALERISVVKSTGPDTGKIFRTLELLGTDHRYLICAYPPFLKHLIDVARETGFPIERYRLMGLVGGEGMSEGLRDYLSPTFQPVYSGYGATDIEIGLAGETPLSVAIRRLAREDAAVRTALFGDDPRLPMLFQYNPLQHHVTTSASGELVWTINRLHVLAPRIAYNIHDEGGVARFDALLDTLRGAGCDPESLTATGPVPVRLPFVWVYGRKDSTVSVMGANLYPEDVEQALFSCPELAARANSFCLGLRDEPDGTVRPLVSFEIVGAIDNVLVETFAQAIIPRLIEINADLREAVAEHPSVATPIIQLHARSAGPFSADAHKIKQTRVIRVASAAGER